MDTPQVTPDLLTPWTSRAATRGSVRRGTAGFWALGLSGPDPALLRGVPMSTAATGAVQRQRLVAAGLRVRDLPCLRDVDTAEPTRGPRGRFALAPRGRFAARLAPAATTAAGRAMGAPSAAPAAPAADPYAAALRAGRGPLFLRRDDGWLLPLEVERWCARADPVDLDVLAGARAPCWTSAAGRAGWWRRSPPRPVRARYRRQRGRRRHTARLGRPARCGAPSSSRCPARGAGAPRCSSTATSASAATRAPCSNGPPTLLAPGGLLIAETAPVNVDERVHVHITDAHATVGAPFPWARLGTNALLSCARPLGWRPAGRWTAAGRPFVALRRGRGAPL